MTALRHKANWLLSSRLRVFVIVVVLGSLIGLLGSWFLWPREEQPTCSGRFDLVVAGAEVIDGLGGKSFLADIGIREKRIACIGTFGPNAGRRVIHAEGLTVAPGFVDVHTHVERNVSPTAPFIAANFVRQGVTTLITGNCGRSFLRISELFRDLEKTGTDINVASLIGHNTIRLRVMKQSGAAPSAKQLEMMKELAEAAMSDGALGLSTGLEYVPGTFASTDELVALAKALEPSGGIYASHLRYEGSKGEEAIREAISIARQSGIHVHLSHLKVQGPLQWGSAQQRLDLVKAAEAEGLRISMDQYPYAASSTGLAILLPSWVSEGGLNLSRRRLGDPAIRKRVRDEMIRDLRALGWQDYSYARIAYCESDRSLVGQSISEVAHRRESARPGDRQAARALVKSTATASQIEPAGATELERQADTVMDLYSHGGAQMVFFNMNQADVETIMRNPEVMFGSDSSVRQADSDDLPHPRGLGTFPRVLGTYARDQRLFSLEEAIRRMTSLPATTFGLTDRGQIKTGYWADLVVFDGGRIHDTATYEKPLSAPEGIEYVLVNGSVVADHGVLTTALPGMAIRHVVAASQ
jgi:N-acyl-D-amino-acid deacylase